MRDEWENGSSMSSYSLIIVLSEKVANRLEIS